jgi:hypothetical protein
MSRLLYKPFSLLVSLLAAWSPGPPSSRPAGSPREEEAPSASDARRRWPEILAASALEGAILAVVKAPLHRGTATAVRQITGTWPGADGAEPESQEP